jgi:2-polyprenyl-6-methoxyphenol hydroxylase-like FAD-dependent oxidoreductase
MAHHFPEAQETKETLMSNHSFDVAIIGGGIGGLCLAQGLNNKAGVSVTVYERDRTRTDRLQGYRIHISPKGSRALYECLPANLYKTFLSACGLWNDRFSFLTDQMHEMLTLETAGDPDQIDSHKSVSRITLREVLLAGLEDVVHFDKTFVRYRETDDGNIVAYFEDGAKVKCDVLVAADGGNSRVRRQFLPQANRIDTGVRGIAGKFILTDESRSLLSPELLRGPALVLTSKRRSMFIAPHEIQPVNLESAGGLAGNGGAFMLHPDLVFANTKNYIMWGFGAPREDLGSLGDPERLGCAALHELVRKSIAQWHPDLQDLVRFSDPATVSLQHIRSSVPIPHWETKRITLVGDAIHSMTPYRGIGGNVALCDASLLCKSLVAAQRGEKSLLRAIHDYELEMVEYGFNAVRKSMRALEQAITDKAIAFAVRKTMFRFLNAFPALKRRAFQNFGDN